MVWSVYQHWDPLKICVVGRSYPPEFYSWISIPHVRRLFEKIATETEEDYQHIIKVLQQFGVEVLRPNLPTRCFVDGKFVAPPMTPRDHCVMIGQKFYQTFFSFDLFYDSVKDVAWPDCETFEDFEKLPAWIKQECVDQHALNSYLPRINDCYQDIMAKLRGQGNEIVHHDNAVVNGAMVSRIGKDLYFGTECYTQDTKILKVQLDNMFPGTRNHVVNTGGHSDGTYCPVCPGLIISLNDVPTYSETFPDWEVVYLNGQSWEKVEPFMELKIKNQGKWWIPGFEHDQDVVNVVENWLSHWTGYVEETVFDVNMLIIDPKNVMVFNYNEQVFKALDKYGITPHVVPFRHRYFWDGGIHCVTTDLHRQGQQQDYFPLRTPG
jgi:hypothetical protein